MVTFFRTPNSKTSHDVRENVYTLPVNTFRISDFFMIVLALKLIVQIQKLTL